MSGIKDTWEMGPPCPATRRAQGVSAAGGGGRE